MENNTIILLKGEADLTIREMAAFTKGDTIFGNDSEPQEPTTIWHRKNNLYRRI